MEVAADLGRDLEHAQEDEEGPEQDGERLEHDLGHDRWCRRMRLLLGAPTGSVSVNLELCSCSSRIMPLGARLDSIDIQPFLL